MTNKNAAPGFKDDFNEPFIDVTDGLPSSTITSELALKADKTSKVNVLVEALKFATVQKSTIEVFWLTGDNFQIKTSLGKKTIGSLKIQMSWPVPVPLMVALQGKKASLSYVYTDLTTNTTTTIPATPAEITSSAFTVDVSLVELYDIYVTGAADHYMLAHLLPLGELTSLTNGHEHQWQSVTRGGVHHLAIDENGAAYAWGNSAYGGTGTGAAIDAVTVPTLCTFSGHGRRPVITQVSTGCYYSLALDEKGHLWGAGINNLGCQGRVDGAQNNDFVQIDERKYKFIAASSFYSDDGRVSFAIDISGDLYRTGYSAFNTHLSALAGFPAIYKFEKVEDGVLSEHKWTSVVHNQYMGAAINEDQEVYVWGNNTGARLGDGIAADAYKPPFKLDFNGSSPKIKKVVLGLYHALALDTDGNVWAWGTNEFNCVSSDPVTNVSGPNILAIGANNKCKDIASDYGHCAAVTTEGKLFVWGHNAYGCLGKTLTESYITKPEHVEFDDKIGGVELGYYSMLVLAKNGK